MKKRVLATVLMMALSVSVAFAARKQPANEATPVEKPPAQATVSVPASSQALGLYNEGVELFQIAQSQGEKGNADGQKKLLREAIQRFESALAKDPTLVDAQSNIGFAWLTLKDNKRAIRAFTAALAINANHLNTLNGLSTAYAFSGDVQRAGDTFNKLTTLDPGNPEYFFNQGSVMQKAGKLTEAQTAYERAIKIDPSYQRALFNLATLFDNQGRTDEAKVWYVKAKAVEISNPIGLEAVRRLEMLQAETVPQIVPDNTPQPNKPK